MGTATPHAAEATASAGTASATDTELISAADAAATILLLAPGFVALKIFHRFGLRSRWSELEWILWSLVATALITLALDIFDLKGTIRLAAAMGLGVVGGIIGAKWWRRRVTGNRELEYRARVRAWPVLAGAEWVQICLADDRRLVGHPSIVTDPAESTELDLYLTDVSWVNASGEYEPVIDEGMWIPEASMKWAQVLGRPVTGD